jgi:photosystem I subunit 3
VKRLTLYFCTFFIFIFFLPQKSFANNGILIDCDKSLIFTKKLNTNLKKLETRLGKYEINTPPALAIKEQIKQTKNRFTRYSESQLLCGTDGLPHLITNFDLNHKAEFLIPGLFFIYITGWIGWVGRKYLQVISTTKNPTEKEIIIDVPLALNIMVSGYLWPINSWGEFIAGDFVTED